ncbi:MAG TPA: hypothetical protein VEZ12_05175 [Herpetosiphonaceae bacterium]|nr:hypothetical protein [Herpetosiphonaceae bacterium]
MLKNVLLTIALLAETFVVLGSLGYVLHQRNRGRHTAWSRRISLFVVLVVLVVLVAGLAWIW